MTPLIYWNPYTKKEEVENIYGGGAMRFLYGNPGGKVLGNILSKPIFSKVYGRFQDSILSRHHIPAFIKDFKIDMAEFEKRDYVSFNEFFVRRFKPGKRTFVEGDRLPAFAEGRYYGFDNATSEMTFPIKGVKLSAAALLGQKDVAKDFEGGPLLVARLCPVDYHRFHFPDDGKKMGTWKIGGLLHSVNPTALAAKGDIFITNERVVTLLDTKTFGKLAYIEVGALCVGRIVQKHARIHFKRGEEKGYFLFGGSTVVVLGEKGRWKPTPEILQRTQSGIETYVRLGDQIGQA